MPSIELRVRGADPEFAEELLFALGASAVRQEDGADEPLLEPPPGATPLWQDTITCGYFEPDADLAAIRAGLIESLPQGSSLQFEQRLLEETDWQDSWKQYAQPLSFGDGRLWIVPSHLTVDAPDAVTVTLDPGLAFGTGSHQSTALCLDWLARTVKPGMRVLDFGCGSGILAIAALKLGAVSAIGVDLDPQALIASRDNAAANGVAERFEVLLPGDFQPQAFDLVVANILAGPLVALAPLLTDCCRPGGRLALAGLLDWQAGDVRGTYAPAFELDADGVKEGWHRVSGMRR